MTMTAPRNQLTTLDVDILMAIPSGRYAYQPDSETPLVFIWIKDYKSGRRAGQRRIRTQHGPWYEDALTVYPESPIGVPGTRRVYVLKREVEDILLGVFCDLYGCAKAYAHEMGVCARCNLELTDQRSRWYGIGPVCDKVWDWYIEQHDNEIGFSYEERSLHQ